MLKFAYILLLLFPLILIGAGAFLLKAKRSITLRTRLTSLFLIVFTGPTILLTLLSILLAITTLRSWTAPRFQNILVESIELARDYRAVLAKEIAGSAEMIEQSGNSRIKQATTADSLINSGDIHLALRRSSSGDITIIGADSSYPDLPETAIRAIAGLIPSADEQHETAPLKIEEIQLGNELLLATIVPFNQHDSEILVGRIMKKSYMDRIRKLTDMAGDSGRFRFLYSRGGERLIWVLAVCWLSIFSVLSVLISRKIAGSVTTPLNELVTAASAITEGRFDFRVSEEPGAGDEVSRLIAAFNRMSDSLNHTKEKLIESQRLASWRDSARKMAHEVKNILTPLSILVTRLARIPPQPDAEKRYFECLQELDSQIKDLSGMATTFSQFAKMPDLRKKNTDLPSLCDAIMSRYRKNHPDITVLTDYDSTLPPVLLDPEQTRRLIVNLCDNAVNAMADTPVKELSVSLKNRKGKILFRVADTGKGIPSSDHHLVFEPYFTGKPHGTGLGLAIVREIADLHGWWIHMESKPGEGTHFSLTITPEVISNADDIPDR